MKMIDRLLDLLFPPKCVFCEGLMTDAAPLCASCQQTLPWTGAACTGTEISACRTCVSPLYYADRVKESVLRYKFHGRRHYAPTFGLLVAQCVRDHLAQLPDLITWVPVSRRRRRKRGYDQAELLARAAGRHLNVQVLPLLEKPLHNAAQTSQKNAAARRANPLGMYRVLDGNAVRGRTILLIDDVVTTGSTLSECVRMLREAGAEAVFCATLACGENKN